MDTNLLLRFVLDDDAMQVSQVQDVVDTLTSRNPAYVSLLVLCEFAWTLARVYRRPRFEVAAGVETLLNMPNLEVERADIALDALAQYRNSHADFGDCCIASLGSAAGCAYTLTFDKAASKLPGMRLLENEQR